MTASRLIALVLASASLVSLAACANDEPRYREVGRGGFGRGGGGDAGRRVNPNVFISPAGKPYRAGRDEPYAVGLWFAAADADHDGKLTPEEFRKDAEAFFHELDTNHDGIVDGFEVQAYEQKVAPEILPSVEGLAAGEGMDLSLGHGRGGRRQGEDGPEIGGSRAARPNGEAPASDRRPQGAGVYGLLNEPEPVAATDTQFDARITVKEFLAAADRRFAALDAKHQGYLVLSELPTTPAQDFMERMRKREAKEGGRPKR